VSSLLYQWLRDQDRKKEMSTLVVQFGFEFVARMWRHPSTEIAGRMLLKERNRLKTQTVHVREMWIGGDDYAAVIDHGVVSYRYPRVEVSGE
jgi:hypothetical protein